MDLPHLAGLRLPRFRGVESILPQRVLDAPHLAIQAGIAALGLRPGLRIAVAVGSRGIAGLPALVAATVAAVCQAGCLPFIVPAMGSHGGATAEGQTAVLATLGVTAKSAGCPIRSHMETVEIATLDGLPIHVDRCAWTEADVILPLVRIKPHTGFRGRYESGICKMLAIGLGKHAAAARLHREGYGRFAELIPAVAAQILATGRIVGAIAVVENASDTLAVLDVIPAAQILAREPELLAQAKTLMPRLPFAEIDVLIIEEIGKDISGTGMDPNLTGRSESGPTVGYTGPRIARIVVLGLSAATRGNATGIGMADVITERCFQAIDRAVTATNVLTSGSLAGGRLPIAVPGDDAAILAAAACVPGRTVANARLVRITSTRHLDRWHVSENLVDEVRATPGLRLID